MALPGTSQAASIVAKVVFAGLVHHNASETAMVETALYPRVQLYFQYK